MSHLKPKETMFGTLAHGKRHRSSRFLWLLILAFPASLGVGCTDDEGPPEGHGQDTHRTVEMASTTGPMAKLLNDEFDRHYKDVEGMTFDQLKAAHTPSYLMQLDFSPRDAAYYQDFIGKFKLSGKAVDILDTLGFVVLPSPSRQFSEWSEFRSPGAGSADIYYRVFSNDLPVFISADSILHAWHRSFDRLLETTEEYVLFDLLSALLTSTMTGLDDQNQAGQDALFYLSVARKLLEPDSDVPASVAAETNRFLALIAKKDLTETRFMGVNTAIDFSQFIPRGHYTHSEKLEQYFMAMMWLGRTDLVLHDTNPNAEPRPREEAAAVAMVGAIETTGAAARLAQLDSYYEVLVGSTNALTPLALLSLCEERGLVGCTGDKAIREEIYAKQPSPSYSSRVFTDVPPISLRFFPQRFAYGAWVTSRTTIPRLKPAVQGGRSMAMPEDVVFALGADRALQYLSEDMSRPHRENLPATLEAVRRTIDSVPPTDLDNTIFNNWLEALEVLASPSTGDSLPQVMRTGPWHDRKMEATLASWSELRHDTILIVEQSTGGIGCQYPEGYVEPLPELYRLLAAGATRLQDAYADLKVEEIHTFSTLPQFISHWQAQMEKLASLAEKELAGAPMDEADLLFLNQIVDLHGDSYYGDRLFDGWYPRLYWTPWWSSSSNPEEIDFFSASPSGVSEPLVADVHTDADQRLALEVATSHPGLMILAVDNGGDISLYGGPVSNYYQFHVALSNRMTDDQWLDKIESGDPPPRPTFSSSYWAD